MGRRSREQRRGGCRSEVYRHTLWTERKAILPMDRCSPAACLLLISVCRGGTGRSQLGPADVGSWHWETQASLETKCFLPHPYFACNCMHMLNSAAKVASASGVHLACCTWARTCIPISAGWLCVSPPPPPRVCCVSGVLSSGVQGKEEWLPQRNRGGLAPPAWDWAKGRPATGT